MKSMKQLVLAVAVGGIVWSCGLSAVFAQEKDEKKTTTARVPSPQPVPPAVQAALNDEQVIASVNANKITLGQFRALLASIPPAFQTQIPAIKGRLLDEHINQEILSQQASKEGLDKDPDVVAALDRAKKELMVQKLFQKEIAQKMPEITDKEVSDYYKANPKLFERPQRVRVAHILTKTENEARDILKKLKKGEPFRDLAEKHSKDPSAIDGGDLGFLFRGQAVAEFDEAAFALQKAGDLSEPVKTQFGYHIIRLIDRKDPEIPKLEDIATEVRNQLILSKQRAALGNYLEDIKSKSNIQINVKLLDEIK